MDCRNFPASKIRELLAIELAPRGQKDRAITGHIDFLQVRNGAVHILDYKPDAHTNKPIAQLAIYALAIMSRRFFVRIPGSQKSESNRTTCTRG